MNPIEAKELLIGINDRMDDSKVNNWELKFLESIGKSVEEGKFLTDKQTAILKKIHAKTI